MADRFAIECGEQSLQMRVVQRAGVDHRDGTALLLAADDIGAGAMEGEGRGVRRNHPAYTWAECGCRAIAEIEGANEGNGHAAYPVTARTAGHESCAGINLADRKSTRLNSSH